MTPKPAPIIRFDNFSCGYVPKDPILKNINLEIFPGEFVLLVGASGAGTSTFGLCLNGVIPFVEGWVEGSLTVAGINAAESYVAELATHVGAVLQDIDSQIINLYVKDEVMFGPENLKLLEEEVVRRAQRALEFVGAAELGDRFVHELSGGQKQKVVIAAVLAMEPEILFLDEPTANLDPRTSSDVFNILRFLKLEGKTIIITEYKMDELVSLADRMVVLGDGEIVFDGEPRELISQFGWELQDRWGLWIPQAAELELLLRKHKDLHAEPFPLHASEAVKAYATYRFNGHIREERPDLGAQLQGEVLIQAENVSYRYNNQTLALKNVSMEVRAGEILALVGPNGSGKTTLSKQFVGLYKPSKGTVTVLGKTTSATTTHELARHIGYVFQYPEHQFVKDSVEEEVSFSLQVLGLDEAEIRERAQEVMAIFGLTGLEKRHPYSLSGGQKRRLSVATMVIIRPQILLMDEPTFGQDRRNTEKMMQAVLEATRSGDEANRSAIVLVTHDMKLVANYATRAVALHQGQKAFDGSPSALFADRELLAKVNLEDPPLFQITRSLAQNGLTLLESVVSPYEFVDAVAYDQGD